MTTYDKKPKKILLTLIKCVVFGFAFHETANLGIWSDSSKTEALSNKYFTWDEVFLPAKNKIETITMEVLDTDRLTDNVNNIWNDIINGVNDLITSIPEKVSNAIYGNFKSEQSENDSEG